MTNPNDYVAAPSPSAAEETAVPPASTLADARAAAVGGRYPDFEGSFNLFDAAGGFRPTFSWPPLLFGLFWFVYRRMYVEGVLLFLVGLGLTFLSETWEGLTGFLSFIFTLFLGLTGRWFYWRAVDRRLEKAMRLHPRDPSRALAWLRATGGVDPWAVIFICGLMLALCIGLLNLGGGA